MNVITIFVEQLRILVLNHFYIIIIRYIYIYSVLHIKFITFLSPTVGVIGIKCKNKAPNMKTSCNV